MAGFVYVVLPLECGPSAPVKIGVADDLTKRLAGIQTGNPFPLSYACAWKVRSRAGANAVEVAAHRILWRQRMVGEWFRCSVDEAIAACKKAAKECGVEIDYIHAPFRHIVREMPRHQKECAQELLSMAPARSPKAKRAPNGIGVRVMKTLLASPLRTPPAMLADAPDPFGGE